jgi:hypothetical protein
LSFDYTIRSPSVGSHNLWKSFRKGSFLTTSISTEKSFRFEIEHHRLISPRQIGWVAHVAAVNGGACYLALRTNCFPGSALYVQANFAMFNDDFADDELLGTQEELV